VDPNVDPVCARGWRVILTLRWNKQIKALDVVVDKSNMTSYINDIYFRFWPPRNNY
jgi:hypothetical protein